MMSYKNELRFKCVFGCINVNWTCKQINKARLYREQEQFVTASGQWTALFIWINMCMSIFYIKQAYKHWPYWYQTPYQGTQPQPVCSYSMVFVKPAIKKFLDNNILTLLILYKCKMCCGIISLRCYVCR